MISPERILTAFSRLGDFLRSENLKLISGAEKEQNEFASVLEESAQQNPWFISRFIEYALATIGDSLNEEKLRQWLEPYIPVLHKSQLHAKVAVINAGNIPVVGFHDFLCVMFSGHHYIGKLSSSDKVLLPAIAGWLTQIEPGLQNRFEFTEEKLAGFDAVIATGSNNTARYFDYYFGKYPHIIRKNRNGVAVLTGNESITELAVLADDVFLYFGMGCRSVAKIFIPEGYSFDRLFTAFEKYRTVVNLSKYMNNYEYYKSIFLINRTSHLDTGFLLLKEDPGFSSPPAVLFTEMYSSIESLKKRLFESHDNIQCIVGNLVEMDGIIPFGNAQKPELWNYADGIDTMKYLMCLK
jgi:hypothetical protein